MKKLRIYFCVLVFLLFALSINAQVLFEENFDSYPAGDLISDPTSTIPDQGGWYCGSSNPVTANALVTPETGKGNVLIITLNSADRKSTRLNSSHVRISYAVFCLKKKKNTPQR